jgi:SAM-dependent methyltransferase
VTLADLTRLKAEREEADRRYNDALTLLDRSVLQALPELPQPPRPLDESQVTPLNERWEIVPRDPIAGTTGWRRRLAGFVWRLVAPVFERQQAFNGALVDHVNRNVQMYRETHEAIERLGGVMAGQLSALARFQTHLILYLQQVTGYVDTRDRAIVAPLHAGLDAVTDEVLRAIEQLQRGFAIQQQSVSSLRRLMAAQGGPVAVTPSPPSGAAFTHLDSYKYVAFEDQFRGSSDEIRRRQAEYLPMFEGAADVLDVGCGRGEFLELLALNGITARGLDMNEDMAELCRAKGLDVVAGDAFAYLRDSPDASLGGLFAAQVVEHLEPGYLIRLLEVAYDKLRPGSKIVLETINPTSWAAFSGNFIRDLTHARALHPDTLQYLLTASGFQRVTVIFKAPVAEGALLKHVPVSEEMPALDEVVRAVNGNTDKLNGLLFGYQDYAVVGERL